MRVSPKSLPENLNAEELGRKFIAALSRERARLKSVDSTFRKTFSVHESYGRLVVELVRHGIKETGTVVGCDYPFFEAGRRVYAVVLAGKMGLSSVDNVLKRHTPEKIDEAWVNLATETLDRLYQPIVDLFMGRNRKRTE